MIIHRNTMTMIRGDSESITISVVDENGISSLLEQGDKVYFTVKKSVNDIEKIMQKVVTSFPENVAVIEIEPIDTTGLDYGEYIYDVQLSKKDGKVMTIISPNKFMVEGEVTYE